jgi:hypothetical protein
VLACRCSSLLLKQPASLLNSIPIQGPACPLWTGHCSSEPREHYSTFQDKVPGSESSSAPGSPAQLPSLSNLGPKDLSSALGFCCLVRIRNTGFCPHLKQLSGSIFKALGFYESGSEGGWCSRTLRRINAPSFALPSLLYFYAIANTVLPLVLSGETELVILPGKALERKKLSSIKVSGLNCLCVCGEVKGLNRTPFWASDSPLHLPLPSSSPFGFLLT